MADPETGKANLPTKEKRILKQTASKELLTVTGDGSRKTIIQSLMKKKPKHTKVNKLQTHKIARSPLFGQLDAFLPKIQKSTDDILKKTEEERKKMDIENVEGCNKVVEMNVLLGQMEEDNDASCSDEEVTTSNLKLPNNPQRGSSSDEATSKKLIAEVDTEDFTPSSPASEESR